MLLLSTNIWKVRVKTDPTFFNYDQSVEINQSTGYEDQANFYMVFFLQNDTEIKKKTMLLRNV